MDGFKDYDQYDALGLAELVRKKEVSPAELCEEAISRIERINPRINAVIHPMFYEARAAVQAPLPEGPFTGVPFLVKDLIAAYAGVPMTMGSRACRNYVPDHDSTLMKRYKATGVVTLGKTNTPEFGLMAITEPELHGPTRNPWTTTRTPGGSSGGAAAAIASGMVPMASGGDGGGSIRIPAAYCGLFGLKPSRGRTPTGPDFGELWQGAAQEHVLTRSVRDSAAMLDAICAPEPGAPYIIPPPGLPYREVLSADPPPLKIALCTRSPINTGVDTECRKAVEHAGSLLENLGHHVEEAEPAIDGDALAKTYLMIYFGEVAADIRELKPILGRKARHTDVESPTWVVKLLGEVYTAGDFVSSKRSFNVFCRQMGDFLQTFDLYLTPTTAFPPAAIGELMPKPAEQTLMRFVNRFNLGRLLKASGIADKIAVENLARTPFTQLANLTGLPAMSVPLYWTADGLPLGVQFVGRFGDEETLLRLAAQLEQAQPWFDRRPAVL